MANDAERKKNKEIASFKKLTTFLLKVPLRHLPSSKVIFVSCDRLVQRAHFKGHIQFARRVFGGKKSVKLQFFCWPGNRMPTGVLHKEN